MIMYIFDMDGTIVQSRHKMPDSYGVDFGKWMAGKKIYITSGAPIVDVMWQVPEYITNEAKGLFPSLGSEYYEVHNGDFEQKWGRIGWDAPPELVDRLHGITARSEYHTKTGAAVSIRKYMINYKVVGAGASYEQRDEYAEWEKETNERKNIIEQLSPLYPHLEFTTGGKVSIDICPKGMNKSQIFTMLREWGHHEPIWFFGDKTEQQGNDYPLANVLLQENEESNKGNRVIKVSDPEDTMNVLYSDDERAI